MPKNFKNRGGLNKKHSNPASTTHRIHAASQRKYKENVIAPRNFLRRVSTAERLAVNDYDLKRPNQISVRESIPSSIFLIDAPVSDVLNIKYNVAHGSWFRSDGTINEVYDTWVNRLADIHSGYMTSTTGKRGDLKPHFFKTDPQYDGFLHLTNCLMPWDSDAMRIAYSNGIISDDELCNFEESLKNILFSEKFQKIVSGQSAKYLLILVALLFHVIGGVLHIHPVLIKTMPLLFRRADNTLVTKSKAPGGGRRSQGAKWIGGERMGTIGTSGKLIVQSAGPAICGAVALRTLGLPPPVEFGKDWGRLDFVLKCRAGLKSDNHEISSEAAEDAASEVCCDLYVARKIREEILRFCEQKPEFAKLRQQLIDDHKAWRHKLDDLIKEYLIGDDYRDMVKAQNDLINNQRNLEAKEKALVVQTDELKSMEVSIKLREAYILSQEDELKKRRSEIEAISGRISEKTTSYSAQNSIISNTFFAIQKKNEFDSDFLTRGVFALSAQNSGQHKIEYLPFLTLDFKNYVQRLISKAREDKLDPRELRLLQRAADFTGVDSTALQLIEKSFRHGLT